MARLPSQRRIAREDLQEADSWIDKLLFPLNSFMESIYNAMNKNLTFEENIQSSFSTFQFETKSDYSIGNFVAIDLNKGLATTVKIQGVLLCQIYVQNKQQEAITEPVFIDWVELNNKLRIKYISGLSNSTKYVCRILIF